MKEMESRELQWTGKRIEYNNAWPTKGVWYSDIQEELDKWLQKQGIDQLFEIVQMSDSARETLYNQAKLNRLVSGIIDLYDELPYRPDEGFDIAWRSLEIFMNHHHNNAWFKDENDKYPQTPQLITKTVQDLVMPLINRDTRVRDIWVGYLSNIPLSALKYIIMRCYIIHDLAINTQIERVSKRAADILKKQLYEDIKKQYNLERDNKPDVQVLRNSSLLLQKILKGEKVKVNGHDHHLELEDRLIFILSCLLYTNRCERFHGDYFSPFKSDLANLDTYAFSYYNLSFCYIYFWTLLWRHCELNNIEELCSLESIINAAQTMQNRLRPLIVAGRKG